jgi:hypothetical protein
VVVDKSWGVPAPSGAPASNGGGGQGAAERAEAMARRQEARLARREADRHASEQARTERRAAEQQQATGDSHAAPVRRRRSLERREGRREQRDTSGYATVVDHDRLRQLAARGASSASLASVFGITEAEVAGALGGGD